MPHLRARMKSKYCCFLLFVSALFFQTPALAEYALQPGDVLDLALIGSPEFTQRLPIGIDGMVSLPLVGQVRLSGLSLSQARELIIHDLANKVYQPPAPREAQRLILPTDIVVTVAEYRPVYVSGQVARPGAYPFRPGMTARQAVVVAGGYGPPTAAGRADAGNPAVQMADLRAQYESLSVEYAIEQDRIWRLRTELNLPDNAKNSADAVPLPKALRDKLKMTAAEYMAARTADRQTDKAAFEDAIAKADIQLGLLKQKKKKDEEGVQADNNELETVRQLFHRGITANARLSEARRAALLSSDQLLQTIVQISNIERQRGDYVRQIEKTRNQAKIDDWRELQQANLRLAQVTSLLKSTSEKLGALALPSASPKERPVRLKIAVVRYKEGKPTKIDGGEDFALAPGDVVDVVTDTPQEINLSEQAETTR